MDQEVTLPKPTLIEKIKNLPTAEKVHYGLMASFVLLNTIDAVTTAGFLQLGGRELNPTMRLMIERFGPTLALTSKIILGSAITSLAAESSKRAMEFANVKKPNLVPDLGLFALSAYAAGIVANNLLLINTLSKNG